MTNGELSPSKIGFEKLVRAIKRCDKDVQQAILEEYEKLP